MTGALVVVVLVVVGTGLHILQNLFAGGGGWIGPGQSTGKLSTHTGGGGGGGVVTTTGAAVVAATIGTQPAPENPCSTAPQHRRQHRQVCVREQTLGVEQAARAGVPFALIYVVQYTGQWCTQHIAGVGGGMV